MAEMVTKQELEDAKVDVEHLGAAVNEDVVVTPRYGVPFKSIPKIAKEYDQNSGTKGFNTLAEFDAVKATIPANTVITISEAGLNQGQNIWDGVTLIKSPYDPIVQAAADATAKADAAEANAKDYFDNSLEIQNKNLCTVETLKTARYVNTSGAIEANPDVAIHVIKIEAGKTYAVKASSFLANAFNIALRATDSTDVGATLGLVTLTDTADATVKNFSIAVDSTAQYAFINVLLPQFSFDIRSSIIVNEGTVAADERVTKIKNVSISDEYARSVMLQNSDVTFASNLYTGVNQASRYVNASGAIEANATTAMYVLPVLAGNIYAVAASSLNTSAFFVAFRASSSIATGATLGLATLTDTADQNVKTFVAPEGATHAFINVLLPAFSFDIRDSLVIQQSTTIVELDAITEIKGNPIVDLKARELIGSIDLNTTSTSPLKAKKLIVIGDSNTANNERAHFKYHHYLAQNVGGMTVYNYGISGTGFFDRHDVASKITQLTPDIVTVLLGANDWDPVAPTLPLGVFGDTGTDTTAGCINTTILALVEKFYKAKLVIITPPPRRMSYGIDGGILNDKNYRLHDIVVLLRQYAEHYSLPLFDLYAESNLHPWLPASDDFYFKPFEGSEYGTVPDGLHPNDAGHMLIALKLQRFLESI